MGQHKTNPIAIAAKNGELPPKKKPIGKREAERLMAAKRQERLRRAFSKAYLDIKTQMPGIDLSTRKGGEG